jgi:hypothetical protein
MKIIFSIGFIIALFLSSSAQYSDKPKDFYVTKHGDTTYGTYISGMKYDGFKSLNGEKTKLKPESIKFFSAYLYNSDKSDYSTQSWISIDNKFYEYIYKSSGKVSLVSSEKSFGQISSSGISWINEVCFFLRADTLSSPFLPVEFYKAAKSFLIDCPDISSILDHAPKKYNKEKTHKATLDDATYIISKYNECMRGK